MQQPQRQHSHFTAPPAIRGGRVHRLSIVSPAILEAAASAEGFQSAVVPGDVLFVKGRGQLMDIGATGGFMGHVLLALTYPQRFGNTAAEAQDLRMNWPAIDLKSVWRVQTVESTRGHIGLHRSEMLLSVDPATGHFSLIGELSEDGVLYIVESESVQLWQSPPELRPHLDMETMKSVVRDMKQDEKSWSYATAARAVLKSAGVRSKGCDTDVLMRELRSCWEEAPICTSVVVIFWQRYLCARAEATGQQELDLILRWMPLKADRGLPGDLIDCMRRCGWTLLDHLPPTASQ